MTAEELTGKLVTFFLALPPVLFGIILHEVAHGWAANKMGDPTAKAMGRLTLNPIKHIDPTGLGVFAFTAILGGFIIGWAKPVPVQPQFFRRPREGMMLVSIAGPTANLLVALACALILKLVINLDESGIWADSRALLFIYKSAEMGVFINIALAWFNLMPIPPLDGSHIVGGLLPDKLAYAYASIGRYGILILILLLFSGVLGDILWPLVKGTGAVILALVGLS
jgi:Zn-dependent protease